MTARRLCPPERPAMGSRQGHVACATLCMDVEFIVGHFERYVILRSDKVIKYAGFEDI
jgi:hypothetical protein